MDVVGGEGRRGGAQQCQGWGQQPLGAQRLTAAPPGCVETIIMTLVTSGPFLFLLLRRAEMWAMTSQS